ncbi:alanine racemase [Pseudomonas sp. GCM10022188]|uniref:alanine racemase n=1 Tax=Pseudomonas TaxID=286 RepID=UPI001E47CD6F|nr:alanine racemase [Pseudomonas oryzagri]MCC6076629.1 alanine racemase [Pseudomonas oryzagri]
MFKRSTLAAAVTLALLAGHGQAAPTLINAGDAADAASATAQSANAWIEIDKLAFEHNIATLQKQVGAKTQICAVMKADAYGHGMDLLMPSVIASGIPCIGVASNEEARIARENGFTGRLMRVRTATLGEVQNALQYDMEELVGDLEFAEKVSQLAQTEHKTVRIHLGLNSAGMSRNGLEMHTAEGKLAAVDIVHMPGLQVAGIMTHFPVEDRAEVLKGLETFKEESAWVIEHAKLDRSKLLLHCANSFTTLEVPEAHLDMVRPGGALYGDTVPSHTEYRRVMNFKSRVASVNEYPAGNKVGYDGTYTLTRDSRLANISVGYSDGYRRLFTNKAAVLINGHRAPVVGKVSMNTLMVDVTEIPDVHPGAEVVLFGKQGEAEIAQAELEEFNGALLADLYTVWGNSNPKFLKPETAAQ